MSKLSDYNINARNARSLPNDWIDKIAEWPVTPSSGNSRHVMVIQAFMLFYNETTSGYIDTLAGINGTYDANTYNAVYAFQQARGLYPDGIVGPVTWRAMAQEMYVFPAQSAASPISPTYQYMYIITGPNQDDIVMYSGSNYTNYYLPGMGFYAQDGNGVIQHI